MPRVKDFTVVAQESRNRVRKSNPESESRHRRRAIGLTRCPRAITCRGFGTPCCTTSTALRGSTSGRIAPHRHCRARSGKSAAHRASRPAAPVVFPDVPARPPAGSRGWPTGRPHPSAKGSYASAHPHRIAAGVAPPKSPSRNVQEGFGRNPRTAQAAVERSARSVLRSRSKNSSASRLFRPPEGMLAPCPAICAQGEARDQCAGLSCYSRFPRGCYNWPVRGVPG